MACEILVPQARGKPGLLAVGAQSPVRLVYAPRFCLVTTKIWSEGHWSPRHVTALGSWTDRVIALRSLTDRVTALRQISVTPLFYLENSRRIHPPGVRAWGAGRARESEPFGSSFYMSPTPPALCKLGWLGVLFVLPEVLTQVLRPSFVLFSRAFPFLVF